MKRKHSRRFMVLLLEICAIQSIFFKRAAGMGSVSIANVVTSIGISGKSKVGEIIRSAIAGKFSDARIKLLELTSVYGMSEGDFLKYANQELYDMKLDHLDELASTNGGV